MYFLFNCFVFVVQTCFYIWLCYWTVYLESFLLWLMFTLCLVDLHVELEGKNLVKGIVNFLCLSDDAGFRRISLLLSCFICWDFSAYFIQEYLWNCVLFAFLLKLSVHFTFVLAGCEIKLLPVWTFWLFCIYLGFQVRQYNSFSWSCVTFFSRLGNINSESVLFYLQILHLLLLAK